MTREIKFKVWDKKNGMNDVFGWYLLSQSGMLWEHSPLEEPTMISYQSDCEILQSTGLTDKN
ncbi:MAG: hypothetical protein FJ368_07150, partial [Pelagibacterales bacterium]|nr:hypothetical protein [Pelagibacterales bacterium]